jgi:hypothetical protein
MCTAYQMSPSLYYPWRDPCVAHAAQAVADPQRTRKAARLEQENARRKPLVGALTFAVNTSDERLA